MPFRDAWLIIGSLLVVVGFAASQPVVAGVGFVVILIGGVSRWWSRRLFEHVSLRRSISERRAFVDEPVTLRVELENQKLLPLPWYEWRLGVIEHLAVDDETLAAAAAPGRHWVVRTGALGWRQRQAWQFTVHGRRRGYHEIGPATLRSADLLGVFPQRLEDDGVLHLTVFPRVFPVEQLPLPAERPFGDRKGRNRLFEDPLRTAGLREYRPGDPLRRIDWKATARSGELRSRVYDPSATQQLYLLVNIDTMAHAWEGYLEDQLELTVSVAASVATWAAGARYAVGILANGAYPDADRPIRLAPSRSRDQLARVLEALAVIQPLTMGDLAGAIARESGRLPAGSTLVLVASLIPEPLAAILLRLASEGHQVAVITTSERAAGGVPAGIASFPVTGTREWSAMAGTR